MDCLPVPKLPVPVPRSETTNFHILYCIVPGSPTKIMHMEPSDDDDEETGTVISLDIIR
jgi:hypothetical protein